MKEKERQAKRNADKVIEQASYRVSMKRKLRVLGINPLFIRNASTEDLKMLCGKLNC